MAENKKSFLFYVDWKSTFDELPNELAGELIKHILSYVNDEEPVSDNIIIRAVFPNIKNTLKRDLVKYNEFIKKQIENGKLGGRPKTQLNPNNPTLILDNPNEAKKPDTDTVRDKVIDKVNNIEERKLKFASTLEPFKSKYGRDMLNSFYKYWTQPNKSNTKFKQELEKTWQLSYRLETWSSREKTNFVKESIQPIPKML
jgi:hypothetical protein